MKNTEYFKGKLLAEKERLEKELGTIATHSNKGGDGWEAVSTIVDESVDADANEVADKIEEYETNRSVVDNLKTSLKDIDDALSKIESGTYGICEVSGHQIEEERLEANPAARTCMAHMND